MAKEISFKCPWCHGTVPVTRGATGQGALQHHLWGGHKLSVERSHEIVKRHLAGQLTQEDINEAKQIAIGESRP